MPHKVTTGPASEPISTAEAKLHLRVDTSADDTLIAALIVAAREAVEQHTNTKLFTQTVQQVFDCFPYASRTNPRMELQIVYGPIQSITSVEYVDEDGNTQTWDSANYRTDLISTPARIEPAYGVAWPSTRDVVNAITVTYVAGYSDTANIPQAMKQAMLLTIGHWYENRTDTVRKLPTQAEWLLNPYRIILF